MSFVRMLGLALIVSLAVTGCSKREDLKLAEFKDRAITVGEFETAYAKVNETFLPKATGLEGKKEFLTTMLNREVMEYKADELGYDKDPAVAQGIEGFRRMTLQVAFLKKNVADKIKITDEDLRQHYDNIGATADIKQMLFDLEEQAEEAYGALESGTDWETVTRQFSKADDAAEGGVVLTAAYMGLMPALQQQIFSLPIGSYTTPVFTAHGWVIVKILKRDQTARKEPFESVQDQLREQVQAIKENIALSEFTEKLRADYGTTWNYETFGVVFNALPPDRPFEEAPRRNDEVYPLLYFDPADMDKTLVTYNNKTITVKDFSDFYDQASFFNRPRRQFRYGGIKHFLVERIMNELSGEAVRKSGIENDPEVAAVLNSKRDEIMVNLLFEDVINKQTVVTAADVRSYYEANQEAYRVPEKRKFGLILAGDMEAAQTAHTELRNGMPLAQVALAYSVDDESRTNNGETKLLSKGEQPEIDAIGFTLRRVGDLSEPFQTSRGWMVLKLIERQDEKLFTLEEAETRIEAALKEEMNDQKLDEMLTKWKEEYGVVIHEKNLEKVNIVERTGDEPRGGHRQRS